MAKKLDEPGFRIVDLNEANIDEYGAFCLQSKKNTKGYKAKFQWTKDRFKEGLHVKLLLVNEGARRGFRTRGFIEYIPGEHAWRGVDAKGYMFIHCIWVVGRNKGRGYGSMLLQECLNDARGMNGVAVMTSEKTWLPKKGLFVKKGFEKVDSMPPYFELYAKRFSDKASLPRFNPIPESRLEKYASGITVFKSDQCPYADGYANLVAETARQNGIPVRIEQIKNCKEAQNSVHQYGTFCVLLNGKVLTYRSISRKELLDALKGAG
jgi:ribosomal protein S18 acetylase RimI-like enzyme